MKNKMNSAVVVRKATKDELASLSGKHYEKSLVVYTADYEKPVIEVSPGEFLHEARLAKEQMIEHVNALRDWTYFVTMTFDNRRAWPRSEAGIRRHLFEWAKYCQKVLRGRFEFVFVVEQARYSPPHLHGLVYVEAGPSTANSRLLEAAWMKNHGITRNKRVKTAPAVGYALKDWDADQTLILSPSLGRG